MRENIINYCPIVQGKCRKIYCMWYRWGGDYYETGGHCLINEVADSLNVLAKKAIINDMGKYDNPTKAHF